MLAPFVPTLVAIHVLTALASIIVGIFAMRSGKSPKRHAQYGKAYGAIMGISMLSGALLLTVGFNFFLAMITVLSTQSLITGWRAAKMKARGKAAAFDWIVSGLVGLTAVVYIGWSLLSLFGIIPQVLSTTFLYIGIGFASFLSYNVYEEVSFYLTKHKNRRAWLLFHFNRMLGSYAALVTAFSITMSGYLLPGNIQWLAWVVTPVLASLLIARYNKTYANSRPSVAVSMD